MLTVVIQRLVTFQLLQLQASYEGKNHDQLSHHNSEREIPHLKLQELISAKKKKKNHSRVEKSIIELFRLWLFSESVV